MDAIEQLHEMIEKSNNYTDTMLVALNCISSILKSGNL